MGLVYEFFAAEDDEAATGILTAAWPGEIVREEGVRPSDLAALEAVLTGRSDQEIAANPRHGALVAALYDEDAGVLEWGVVTVTDTLTRALAAADPATLAAAWPVSGLAVAGLAAIARLAEAHGHRMYCFWTL
jgi:hypothetical protein